MIRRAIVTCALVATVAAASEFRFERPVAPGGAGPNRLDVDLALLAEAASDLRDLRLYDESGREVPYLLVQPEPAEAKWKAGSVLPIAATKISSGFESDLGAARAIDRLRVSGIRAPFLKRVRVEGSGDRARWTLLADTTLFDLPDEQLRRDVVDFTPGEFRYLRLTWDDRSSAGVVGSPSVAARIHGSGGPSPIVRASVPFAKRPSEPGRTRYRIDLPGQNLPITAIDLVVPKGDVFRDVMVTEPRLTNAEIVPAPLGSGRLKQAERDGVVASDLTIPISTPMSRELDLAIDDGNNPPLEVSAAMVRLAPQPWIYFQSDGRSLVARYGAPRLAAPKYDLQAARKLIPRKIVVTARWQAGPAPKEVSSVTAEAALPPFGAAVDKAAFRYERGLPQTPAGLTVVLLDPEVMAHSSELRDVRIIDRSSRQVPYVVEHRHEPLMVPLTVPPRTTRQNNKSVYSLRLPHERMPAGARIALTTSGRVFQRNVEVWQSADERRGSEAIPLTNAMWRSMDPSQTPPVLTFDVPSNSQSLEIVVAEGDNAPLPIAAAKLYMPGYALRFYHPGAPLSLIYGNPQARAPEYDLALLAPRLFQEKAREVRLLKTTARSGEDGEAKERRYFWIAIAVVALALLALLVRLLAPLVREEPRPLG